MIKKLDKFILQSFIGPFILTAVVVTFILLTQTLMRYFDDFVGKDLGLAVFAELISYFSISITPVAFPLAVLLSSLITFGNLGEHFELTAIKSAGISLLRAMRPILLFVITLTAFALYSNNYIVPKANLDSYSLLYDIRQKKPSMDIKEGAFYNGIPGYSIKANKKYPDNETLGDIIIYNHAKGKGNVEVIIADSAKMYTILEDQYLVMELFKGRSYTEGDESTTKSKPRSFVRNEFDRNKLVFSLSSFDMKRTDKELFSSNRLMKNAEQLVHDRDSMLTDVIKSKKTIFEYMPRFYSFHLADTNGLKSDKIYAYESKQKQLARLALELAAKDSIQQVQDSLNLNNDTVAANQRQEAEAVWEPKTITEDEISFKSDTNDSKETRSTSVLAGEQVKAKKLETLDFDKTLSKGTDTKKELIGRLPKGAIDSLKISEIAKKETAQTKTLPASIKQYDAALIAEIDSIAEKRGVLLNAEIDKARFAKNRLKGEVNRISSREKESRVYDVYAKEKYAQAIGCLIMFLIGAPLGAIIKKGGLGVPILISIVFFIFSYVISQTGIKLGREGTIDPWLAVSLSNLTLLPFGILFLQQARNDSRIFEVDVYLVAIEKVKQWFKNKIKK